MRARFPVAVHLFLFRDDRVLLSRRANTGWEDGKYSVPAGHMEAGESVTAAAIREAREEVGLELSGVDLEFVHVMNRHSEEERVDFFFVPARWSGEPINREPEKCDDLAWFSLEGLPDNMVAYVRAALSHVRAGLVFSEFGWD